MSDRPDTDPLEDEFADGAGEGEVVTAVLDDRAEGVRLDLSLIHI